MLNITYHAAQRFVERVIQKATYTKNDIHLSKQYLSKVLQDVVVTSYSKNFALPGFENKFIIIQHENSVITIIPKD